MKSKQIELNIYQGQHGGRRPGSGRKRIHSRGVAHRTREKMSSRPPLHINFKFRTNIRNKTCLKNLKRAILNSRRQGLRVLHCSLQSNHVHLIVEAETNTLLTKGMRSLTVTFAKGLKKGRVQLERYHLHVLRTLRETKNALHYVLFNKQKHEKGTCTSIDEYTSLLALNDALKWIRSFAVKRGILINVERCDWELDEGRSWLSKKALVLEGL